MASQWALIGSNADAFGHPTECEEPADGSVSSETSTSVTVNGSEIATINTATLSFPSHSHDYSDIDGCHQNQSHSLDPDDPGPGISTSVTVNGSPVYLTADNVATDPTSGGNIDITNSGGNNSVTET